MAAARLSPLSAPGHHVRHRPCLSLHPAATAAGAHDARRMAALAQHHGHQRDNRGSRRRHDMARRHRSSPARASAHHAAGGIDRCLAVLRPAPVRGHVLGKRKRLEPAGGRTARQLALPPAGGSALVYRQYRRASCAPFVQSDSILSAASGSARLPRARPGGPADTHRERSLHPPRIVGRNSAATGLLPGAAPPQVSGGSLPRLTSAVSEFGPPPSAQAGPKSYRTCFQALHLPTLGHISSLLYGLNKRGLGLAAPPRPKEHSCRSLRWSTTTATS